MEGYIVVEQYCKGSFITVNYDFDGSSDEYKFHKRYNLSQVVLKEVSAKGSATLYRHLDGINKLVTIIKIKGD